MMSPATPLPPGAGPARPFGGAGPGSGPSGPPPTSSSPVPTTSRNDLFQTNWTPSPPPPPLATQTGYGTPRRAPTPSSLSLGGPVVGAPPVSPPHSPVDEGGRGFAHTLAARSVGMRRAGSGDSVASWSSLAPPSKQASRPPSPDSPPSPVAAASKTSSFFATAGDGTPPPPSLPRPPPSPLALSRAASLRRTNTQPSSPTRSLRSPRSPTTPVHARTVSADADPPETLSPLHQSPSLAPQWTPPPLAATDDVDLRLVTEPAYLLGEGRYASVYLAAYRPHGCGSARDREPPTPTSLGAGARPADTPVANATNTEWTLCAAKRLAPDRESQTMGLREAFFLNRLGSGQGRGKVYVVRLFGVKNDEGAGASRAPVHARRCRASTVYAGGQSSEPPASPAAATMAAPMPPPPARLVLVLEHAPLGALDRLLRSSPSLVGPHLWGRWAREAAAATEWVHSKGVVHADIKPSNLLLTTDLHLRLADFGSSLLIHPSAPPTDGVGLGTLPFSPPELVDPSAPFSFPVDVFALGATLLQCVTGREPYRGARPVEMMHHVRNGGLWAWAERDRLLRIGEDPPASAAASPYPSAWRADPVPGAEVRRGGSLRVPAHYAGTRGQGDAVVGLGLGTVGGGETSSLKRVGSTESLRAWADAAGTGGGDSPAGVRLWATWHHGRSNAVDRLLSTDPAAATPPRSPVSRASSLRVVRRASDDDGVEGQEAEPVPAGAANTTSYADSSPPMYFLGPGDDGLPARVPDAVRDLLRAMLEPAPEARPTASDVLDAWDELGVGAGDAED